MGVRCMFYFGYFACQSKWGGNIYVQRCLEFLAGGSPITRLKHQPLSTCFWMVLLMDEIRNNHQRCIKPVNTGIDNCTNLKWCGISSINCMFIFFVLVFTGLSMFHIVSFLYTLYICTYTDAICVYIIFL